MDYSYKPTTHGRAVMAACMALGDKPFTITRIAFGSGKVDAETNLADVHELISYVCDGSIVERRHESDRLYLTLQYANIQHPEVKAFLLSEFMIFVTDPVTGEETDFVYGTLGDYRQPVPAYNPKFPPSELNYPLVLILSDEINVEVSAPVGLVTYRDLDNLIVELAVRQLSLTIPAEGWAPGGVGRYPMVLELPVEGVEEVMIPYLTVLPEGEGTAIACGLSPRIETGKGVVRLWAAARPANAIPARLTLMRDSTGLILTPSVGTGAGDAYSLPLATSNTPGAVRPGRGLIVAPDGTLSVDVASEAEIRQLLAEASAADRR